jgi:hypothetical protein
MAGRSPDAVRWRRGKEHLGRSFTTALMAKRRERMRVDIEASWHILASYVNEDTLRSSFQAYFDGGDAAQDRRVYDAAHLAAWLIRNAERPPGRSANVLFDELGR